MKKFGQQNFGYPTGKTGDRGDQTEFYVLKFYVPFLPIAGTENHPKNLGQPLQILGKQAFRLAICAKAFCRANLKGG